MLKTPVSAQVDPAQLTWLRHFETEKGRPLRVLHIGNIANNAYINAKIMRRIGIEADVLCADYYHAMGCPEWEDIPGLKAVSNADLPDFWEAGKGTYQRPRWFTQGPRRLSMRYLNLKNKEKKVQALLLWYALETLRWARVRQSPVARILFKVMNQAHWLISAAGYLRHPRRFARFLPDPLALWVKKHLGRPAAVSAPDGRDASAVNQSATVQGTAPHGQTPPEAPAEHCGPYPLLPSDISTYASSAANPDWLDLCAYYDVIQGYATEGFVPYLTGTKARAVYEHGTIRDIPFEDSLQGRTCAASYQNTPVVFITNTDCVAAADRLGIPREHQFPIPHGFDSSKTLGFHDQWRASVPVLRSPPSFIAPARQHWSEGFPTWRKGNDLIVKAAKILSDRGLAFEVVFVEWGKEVALTRQLIEQLQVGHHFRWVPPMDKSSLWKVYLQSAAVIDQFVMKAIGSVTFEAMAIGRPVLTALDEPVVAPFFGAMPPVYNTHTAEQLAEAMATVIQDFDAAEDMGKKAQEWIKLYHSSERILSIHLSAYRTLL